MGTVRGGRIVCDRCGEDCKALYGFAMTVHKAAQTYNNEVKSIVDKIDAKYGKHDFIICWDCTIEMMGIKPKDVQSNVALSNENGSKISGTPSPDGVRGDRATKGGK